MSAAVARSRPTGRAGVAERSRLTATPARTTMSATTNPRRSLRLSTWPTVSLTLGHKSAAAGNSGRQSRVNPGLPPQKCPRK